MNRRTLRQVPALDRATIAATSAAAPPSADAGGSGMTETVAGPNAKMKSAGEEEVRWARR